MRTITFAPAHSKEYGLLVAAMYNSGGYKSKDLKVARRVLKKLQTAGSKKEQTEGRVTYELEKEAIIQLEEAEFSFLKERFESIQDWHASVVETAATVLDILEATKEDAT